MHQRTKNKGSATVWYNDDQSINQSVVGRTLESEDTFKTRIQKASKRNKIASYT